MRSNDPIADLQLPRSPKTCDLPAKRNILRWSAGNKSSCNRLSWNKDTSYAADISVRQQHKGDAYLSDSLMERSLMLLGDASVLPDMTREMLGNFTDDPEALNII